MRSVVLCCLLLLTGVAQADEPKLGERTQYHVTHNDRTTVRDVVTEKRWAARYVEMVYRIEGGEVRSLRTYEQFEENLPPAAAITAKVEWQVLITRTASSFSWKLNKGDLHPIVKESLDREAKRTAFAVW